MTYEVGLKLGGQGRLRPLPLFELDRDLIRFHRISLSHSYIPDLAGDRRGDISFHFHGFDNEQRIVNLYRLSRRDAHSDHQASNRTAADFFFVNIFLRHLRCSSRGGRGLNGRWHYGIRAIVWHPRRRIVFQNFDFDFVRLSVDSDLKFQL
jgi:hypothetical protein